MTIFFAHAEDDALRADRLLSGVLADTSGLPSQVFRAPYSHYLFFSYGNLQREQCWATLLSLSAKDRLSLIYLDPHYRSLRSDEVGKFGILFIDGESSWNDVARSLWESPTANLADSFNGGCHRCLLVGPACGWFVYGDRGWDLAVAAFSSFKAKEEFRVRANQWLDISSAKEAVDFVQRVSGGHCPDSFAADFLRNYETR
jgi:hypothetical protein